MAKTDLNKKDYRGHGNLDPFLPFATEEAGPYTAKLQLLSLLFHPGELVGAYAARFRVIESSNPALSVGGTYCTRYAQDSDVLRNNINMQDLCKLLQGVEKADAKDESFDLNAAADRLIDASTAEVLEDAQIILRYVATPCRTKKAGAKYTRNDWSLISRAA